MISCVTERKIEPALWGFKSRKLETAGGTMKSSVQQFARELDHLCRNNIPMSQAFDMLENTAKSNMDLIVINVMRDSFNEVLLEERGA